MPAPAVSHTIAMWDGALRRGFIADSCGALHCMIVCKGGAGGRRRRRRRYPRESDDHRNLLTVLPLLWNTKAIYSCVIYVKFKVRHKYFLFDTMFNFLGKCNFVKFINPVLRLVLLIDSVRNIPLLLYGDRSLSPCRRRVVNRLLLHCGLA